MVRPRLLRFVRFPQRPFRIFFRQPAGSGSSESEKARAFKVEAFRIRRENRWEMFVRICFRWNI